MLYFLAATEVQSNELQSEFKRLCDMVGDIHNISVLFYEILCKEFRQSSYPIPSFVYEILKLRSRDELLEFLTIETPYLSPFNIELMEEVIKAVDNKGVKERLSYYKEILFNKDKSYILHFIAELEPQKENFSKVVFQMNKCFDFCKYEGFYMKFLSLILFILKLKIVGLGGYDKINQTVTCFIPCLCTTRAIINASSCADQFNSADIRSITIDGHTIIQDESLLVYKNESCHDITSMSNIYNNFDQI